jgi:hypothetical protein
MKTLARLSLCLGLFAPLVGGSLVVLADTTSDLNKSFTVSPGGALVVAASRGTLELVTGADDKLDVQVYRKVTRTSESKAREILASHEVTFSQDGGTVTVRDKAPAAWSKWNWWGGGNLQVRYVITLPARFDLDLKTAGGSITVPDHTGKVVVATSGGNLNLGGLEGPVNAHTSGGSITLGAVSGPLEARTSGGTIDTGELKAGATLGTSGGSIHVKRALGPLTAKTSGGSIEVGEAHAGVDASTSGGSVTAALAGGPTGDCRLSTSGGNIRVKLPAATHADLDAKTSGGSVKSDLPVTVQGTVGRNELVGKLGEGGRLIRLRTSGGSIHLSPL